MTAPILVGISGGSCSGKTTFTRRLADLLRLDGVRSLSFDSYYRPLDHLPLVDRHRVNFDHPDSLDADLLARQLASLRAGEAVDRPSYDFATHARLPATERLEPTPFVLVDGILLLAFPQVTAQLDLTVFIDAPASVRLERRVRRDTRERGRTEASVREQFAATVAPMHERFVQPGAQRADLRFRWDEDLGRQADDLTRRLRAAARGPVGVRRTLLDPQGSPGDAVEPG